eukprot:scaffold6162_cov116-Isochrysis_galbana.AAC.1
MVMSESRGGEDWSGSDRWGCVFTGARHGGRPTEGRANADADTTVGGRRGLGEGCMHRGEHKQQAARACFIHGITPVLPNIGELYVKPSPCDCRERSVGAGTSEPERKRKRRVARVSTTHGSQALSNVSRILENITRNTCSRAPKAEGAQARWRWQLAAAPPNTRPPAGKQGSLTATPTTGLLGHPATHVDAIIEEGWGREQQHTTQLPRCCEACRTCPSWR